LVRTTLAFLARHRWAGVSLALVAEILLLAALGLAPASATIGIPAAVAAATAGTVAVVFGVVDGVVVAGAGAAAFAALNGWGAGEIAAIAVWPAIVAAVGLFARRVDRHRAAFRHLVEAQEEERRSLALTLHDESAQTLTGALLSLRAGRGTNELLAVETERARDLINETIQQLRRLALDLSPKALEDYGLAAALGHLADEASTRSEVRVEFAADWDGRLPREAERTLFRFAQTAVGTALQQGASALAITLTDERDRIAVEISVPGEPAASLSLPPSLDERFRFLHGKLSTHRGEGGEMVFRAEVPAQAHAAEGGNNAALV
jgi:signal transduction histidine kinase